MSATLLLASGSAIRAEMLRRAGLAVETARPGIDEAAVKEALLAEGAGPRDIADALAEAKARKISLRHPGTLVLGADQTLSLDDALFSKPASPEEAIDQLRRLSGREHVLHSAAVVCEDGEPIWRHVGEARLTMHRLSEPFLAEYVARNWDDIRHSVGGYLIEAEGVRLFARLRGDHFTIQGLPLVELLSWLRLRGTLPT